MEKIKHGVLFPYFGLELDLSQVLIYWPYTLTTFTFLLVQSVHLMTFASYRFSGGTIGNKRTGDKKIPVC